MITLGTGVGGAIIINGKPFSGAHGVGSEIGHMMIGDGWYKCNCGNTGCFETYCSATGVARTAREFLSKSDAASELRNMNPEDITSYDVFLAAEKGDKIALDIFDYTGTILGRSCADFATFNTPEAFVFFGGLTKAGEYLMKPLRKAYEENVLFMYKNKTKLLISALNGSEAAVLGASALGWE